MVVIGVILDLILESKMIPAMDGPISGTLMMILGLFVISLATFLHEIRFRIGSTRRTYGHFRKKVRSLWAFAERPSSHSRCCWVVDGGPVGLGTLIAAFGTGLCIQITFSLLKFNATKIEHESLGETARFLLKSAF